MFVSEVISDKQLTVQMLSKVFMKVEKYFQPSYMQAKWSIYMDFVICHIN